MVSSNYMWLLTDRGRKDTFFRGVTTGKLPKESQLGREGD